ASGIPPQANRLIRAQNHVLTAIGPRYPICVAKRVIQSAWPMHVPDGVARPNRIGQFVWPLPKSGEQAGPLRIGRPPSDDKFETTFTRRTGLAPVRGLERVPLLHLIGL